MFSNKPVSWDEWMCSLEWMQNTGSGSWFYMRDYVEQPWWNRWSMPRWTEAMRRRHTR